MREEEEVEGEKKKRSKWWMKEEKKVDEEEEEEEEEIVVRLALHPLAPLLYCSWTQELLEQQRLPPLPPQYQSLLVRLCLLAVPLCVFGLQFAGHVEQQVLVVNHLQLADVGLRLQVGGGRLCIHGYQVTQGEMERKESRC